jgi:two-component system sensor histidine kinase EvgS
VRSASEIAYPPFCVVGEDGRADGFSVELMRAALARMGREVTFRTGPWAEVRGWLERGEIDALPLVGRTPEREALFDFTVPYLTMHGAIVVREGPDDVTSLDDLRGRRVAVMEGDNAEEFLRREDRGLEIITTPTFVDAFHVLADGGCEAVVIQRLVAVRLLEETGLRGLKIVDRPVREFAQDFCFAVREGDRELLSLLNEGLALVVADGTHRRLHAKWFAHLQLPTDRPIIVGGDHGYPPFEYLSRRGVPAGYNVELTRAVAAEMGLDVEIRLGPWDEIVEGLEDGEIDVLQGMFYLPSRDAKLDFTQPHAASSYVGVVRADDGTPPASFADLTGRRIVVQRGGAIHEILHENGLDGQVALADSQEDALRQLAEGKHDCALVVRVSALALMDENGWTSLRLARQPFVTLDYCYAALDDRKALLAQFSEGLNVLERSGEHHRIFDKWLGIYDEAPVTLLTALRYSALILVLLLAVLVLALLWSWSLRRQVASQTRQLRESLSKFRSVFETANVGKSMTAITGEVDVNRAFADMLGHTT